MAQTITEIYEHYNIPPWLQEHMLRVSAVASIICDQLGDKVRKHEVVSACLLHDMGNIIKFQFEKSKKFYDGFLKNEEEIEYWKKVQSEYFKKYGHNEHVATDSISREVGVSDDILKIINHTEETKNSSEVEKLELKVAEYSDMRVGPFGVVSIEDRLNNLSARSAKWDEQRVLKVQPLLEECEKDIFASIDLSPEDISDKNILGIIEELRNYKIV